MVKTVVLCVMLGFLVCLSGCETTAGAASGLAYTIEGAGKDTVNIFGALSGIDSWMRKNLW